MLNTIKTKLYNINKRYDGVEEPTRLALFMLLIIICYIPSFILISFDINNDFVIISPTLLLIPFGFIRWLWLTGRLDSVNK